MTKKEEQKFNEQRDKAYLAEAEYVWKGDAKGFGELYRQLHEKGLYNGTSFQKEHYPNQYEQYLATTKHNNNDNLTRKSEPSEPAVND